MASPFASFANATLSFQVASGALTPDAKGNLRPGTAIVTVEALLQQKRDPNEEMLPGVDKTAVWVEGYITRIANQDDLVLPTVITPDSPCSAVWQGRQGRFHMQFNARNPYLAALSIDLVERLKGYFQIGNFVVSGDPWTPTPPPADSTGDIQEAETDSTVVPGQPLYLKQNGHVDLASAAAIGTARVAGICTKAASTGTSAEYSPDGVVDIADWTAIVGTATLTPGATYFLSTTAGRLSTTAPTESGQVVIAVGTALTTTKLAIEIQLPILL